MKFKKTACMALALMLAMGTAASAKDNIYAYNKFVSTIIGPRYGYCNFSASFAGHENEYENVNTYFGGLISAFYDDIDGDFDNELVTVETTGVTVYQAAEKGVVFLGSADVELIANYGDSYANVFTIPDGRKKYIGIETYAKSAGNYHLYLYDLNPDTDDFKKILDISRESNEEGIEESVWAKDKTYYSYTAGGGLQTSINPDGYLDCGDAAVKALCDTVSYLRDNQSSLSKDRIQKRMVGGDADGNQSDDGNYRINEFMAVNVDLVSYIRATGVRLADRPIVIFEDNSPLNDLAVKPDIVTVTVNNETLQFPTQDPVIVDGRTLVPVRTIIETFDAKVDWIDEDGVQKVIVNTADKNISMTINSKELYVNGERQEDLEVPAQLINDKTLVPLRVISEALGCNVSWVQETKTVVIESQNEAQ